MGVTCLKELPCKFQRRQIRLHGRFSVQSDKRDGGGRWGGEQVSTNASNTKGREKARKINKLSQTVQGKVSLHVTIYDDERFDCCSQRIHTASSGVHRSESYLL